MVLAFLEGLFMFQDGIKVLVQLVIRIIDKVHDFFSLDHVITSNLFEVYWMRPNYCVFFDTSLEDSLMASLSLDTLSCSTLCCLFGGKLFFYGLGHNI